jgi:hypothetical protein
MAAARAGTGRFLLLSSLLVGSFGVGALLPAQPPAKTPPPGGSGAVRPILKTGELMKQFNGPRFKQLKMALAAPVGDRDPKAVFTTAREVAEIANLIAIRRPDGPDGREWEQLAVGLQEAALKLADSLQGGAQTVDAAAGRLIQACNRCHQRFAPDEAPMLK